MYSYTDSKYRISDMTWHEKSFDLMMYRDERSQSEAKTFVKPPPIAGCCTGHKLLHFSRADMTQIFPKDSFFFYSKYIYGDKCICFLISYIML